MQNKILKLNDAQWLDEIPIAPFPITRSQFSDMINIMYFYTHNISREFISSGDMWKIFRDCGYIAYDTEKRTKYVTSEAEDFFELRNGTTLFITEKGQRFFIDFLKTHIILKQRKKKRHLNT